MSGRQRIGAATFIVAIAAALSGCSGGERSAEYFAAHEADAKQVLADCTAGRARGPECDNAQRGLQKANGERASKPSNYPVTGGKGY